MFAPMMRTGGLGLLADIFAPQITGGQGTLAGIIYGLFKMNSGDMDRVYSESRYTRGGWQREVDSDDLFAFGERTFSRSDSANIPAYYKNLGLSLLGGALLNRAGRGFVYPTWLAAIHNATGQGSYMPYTKGGHLVDAWRNGWIPNWGGLAGTVT